MKRHLLLLLIALAPALCRAQAGNVDSTFGALGRKLVPFAAKNSAPADKGVCLIQQAPYMLYAYSQVSAAQGAPMAIRRVDADGNVDNLFGINGTATIQFGSLVDAEPKFITIIDSKIYIGGKAGNDMALARLSANGVLDTSFNHTGKVTIDFGGTDEFPIGIMQYNSNPRTLYIAGNTDSTWAVAKLKLNGALDPAFSTDGKHTFNVGKGRMIGYEQSAGSPWGHMMGYSRLGDTGRFQFTLIRVNTAQPTTTQTLRAKITSGHNIVRAIAYSGNYAYLAAECHDAGGGNTKAGVLAVEFNSVSVNNRFATAGRMLWGLPGQDVMPYSAKVRTVVSIPNLVIGGQARQGAAETAFLLKLDKNGYGDRQFNGKGYQLHPFGQPGERITDIEFTASRVFERIIAIGPASGGNVLWSKTKNNTVLNVRPGWFPVQCPRTIHWNKIIDGGNNAVLLTGDSGAFYHWNQAEDFVGTNPPIITWHRIATGSGLTRLNAYKSSASPTDYWLVGDTGWSARSGADGINNTWGRTGYGTRQNLNGVGSSASGVGYVVGDSGLLVYRYDWNRANSKLWTGTRQKLNSIYAQSYIVGDSGVILKYVSAQSWRRLTSPTTRNLHCVTVTNSTVAVAVGDNGTILRSTNGGTDWTQIVVPFMNHLYGVDGSGGFMNIVGEGGLILRSTDAGATWRQQISPTTNTLRSVINESATYASAAGDNGTVIHMRDGGVFVANAPVLAQPEFDFGLYPNPAGQSVQLRFTAERPGRAHAQVLDLAGRSVQVLFDEAVEGGDVAIPSALRLPPGCYLVRLEVGGRVAVQKLAVE